MNCPACGNTSAECIIGNYYTCPGRDCKNNPARSTNLKTIRPGEELDFLGEWLNTLYAGSPWCKGQHKVAVEATQRPRGTQFTYSALVDTMNEVYNTYPRRDPKNSPDLSYHEYEVELISPALGGEWMVEVVQDLTCSTPTQTSP